MKRYLTVLILCIGLASCDRVFDVNNPIVDGAGFIEQMHPIPQISRPVMDGVYKVIKGNEHFGNFLVIKWSGDPGDPHGNLSLFTYQNSCYAILKGGYLENFLFFSGYWRNAVNSDVGLLNFNISAVDGGNNILSGDTAGMKIVIRGTFGEGDESLTDSFHVEYLRPFSDSVRNNPFYILAHRGGGRNSDYLGASENSINMISLAERLGANGVELDVQLTRDDIPILYHDPDINLRLTQKSVIWGDIEDFTFDQLSVIRLKNGERIPTLEEALNYIIDYTDLQFVWLDLKSHFNEIPAVKEVREKVLQRKPNNRNIEIVLGIPTDEKYNYLLGETGYADLPSLCELSYDKMRTLGAIVWAPRWTEGIQTALVSQVHSVPGNKAFVWTLDEPVFIETFLRDGDFDGILTNYPTLVAYYHYTR